MKKYRCPSPIASGDCPYYDENGYCLMVNNGSNPLKECDDAIYFDEAEEGWENDILSRKSSGIIRRIDDLGRIVIPKELRRSLGFRDDSAIEMFTSADKADNKYLILTLYNPNAD